MKSKGAKKPIEKIIKDLGVKDLEPAENPPEIILSKIKAEPPSAKNVSQEVRIMDANDWKSMKKVDYLRLETVLEEGQVSSEEGIPKRREESLDQESSPIVEVVELTPQENKSKFSLPIEKPEAAQEEKQSVKLDKEITGEPEEPYVQANEKKNADKEGSQVGLAPVDSSGSKKPLDSNGNLELLPIFSNDKFQCSRDAISIGESDDLCAMEKNPAAFSTNEKKKENKIKEKNDNRNAFMELSTPQKSAPVANTFALAERKQRFKAFTEKQMNQTSSYFIHSLLVLPPFAKERDFLLEKRTSESKVKKMPQRTEPTTSDNKKDTTHQTVVNGEDSFSFEMENESAADVSSEYQKICLIVFSTFAFISFMLALAWHSYEPPCLLDYILGFIPFLRRRRTCLQLFFDRVL